MLEGGCLAHMAYRFAGRASEDAFRLRGQVSNVECLVVQDEAPIRRATGAELASDGLRIALDAEWRSSVIEIEAQQ